MAHFNPKISHKNDEDLIRILRVHDGERVLPAMPITVVYCPIEKCVSMEYRGKEPVFRLCTQEKPTLGWDDSPLDAYELREWFEHVGSAEEAFKFLRLTGSFPGTPDTTSSSAAALTWGAFRRWQTLVRRLRVLDPLDDFPLFGYQMPDLKQNFDEHEFWSDDLMEMKEQVWSAPEQTFLWIQGIPTGLRIERDRYLYREEIAEIFSKPEAHIQNSRAWHDAHAVLARRQAERAAGNAEKKHRLRARVVAGASLDAILATIYLDNLRGIETRVCALNDCDQVFEVRGRKEYCSNYHAHLASIRKHRRELQAKKKEINKKGY